MMPSTARPRSLRMISTHSFSLRLGTSACVRACALVVAVEICATVLRASNARLNTEPGPADRQQWPGSLSFRMDIFALIARGGFRFQEIVDLVFEPRDRVLAEIDVLRKFSGRLEPADVYARPGDPALSESLIIEESSAGLFAGDFWTCCHENPRTLMLCEDLPHRTSFGVPDNS